MAGNKQRLTIVADRPLEGIAEMHRLFALMVWPGQHEKQRRAVATWNAKSVRGVEARLEPGLLVPAVAKHAPSEAAARAFVVSALPELRARILAATAPTLLAAPMGTGGDEAAVMREMRQRALHGLFAGWLLQTLVAIDRHHPEIDATLNRAVHAVEQQGMSARALKSAWVAFRPVAPLWAALTAEVGAARYWGTAAEGDATASLLRELQAPLGRERFFGHAAWFQAWGVRHRPARASAAILARDAVAWLAVPPISPPVPPLTGSILERARAYRGPDLTKS